VEGHIDARKGDSRDAALQGNIPALRVLLLLRNLEAVVDNVLQHTLDLFDAERFKELISTVRECHPRQR
jgi:hypothetical protein